MSQITYNCIACQRRTLLSALLVSFCSSLRNISSPLPALALAAETNNNYHCVTPQRHRTSQLCLHRQKGLQIEPGLFFFSFCVSETDSWWQGYELQGCSWHTVIISTVCKWESCLAFWNTFHRTVVRPSSKEKKRIHPHPRSMMTLDNSTWSLQLSAARKRCLSSIVNDYTEMWL